MTLAQMIKIVNLLCDENYSSTDIVEFLNNGIAYINKNLPANFPYMTTSTTEYSVFDNYITGVLTADYTTGYFTLTGQGVNILEVIEFVTSTGTLPAGILASPQRYFPINITLTETEATFQVSSIDCGEPIEFTDNGTTGFKIKEAGTVGETIIRTVLIPFACMQLKQNDGDLTAKRDFEMSFKEGFEAMKRDYKPTNEYKTSKSGKIVIPSQQYQVRGEWL